MMHQTAPPITTVNPASGEPVGTFDAMSREEIDTVLACAHEAFQRWSITSLDRRERIVRALAAHLRANKARFAARITLEMGKTIVEAEAEIDKSAWACEYYADNAGKLLAPEPVETNASRSYVAYRPLGCILAVMPWNFPFFQVLRFAVPAILGGNVTLLKHASNVTGCALELQHAFEDAGFPVGVFTTLLARASQIGDVIADARIAAVTLTGSEAAGSAVAATAGRYLKKTVLELGGSDAYVVLRDADIAAAARTAVRARFQNCGQSCIAAKRFIVEEAVYDQFLHEFVENVRALKAGDPMDRGTTLGPLARHDLVDEIERQVAASVAMGARPLIGAQRIAGPGAFYQPTVLADVGVQMPVFREETFGPAAAVMRAPDCDEAIALANASPFGLGNNVWTSDLDRAERIAARLQSGLVFVNGMTASDPRLPFGGVKKSGYGRELGHFGIREFMNAQTVSIA